MSIGSFLKRAVKAPFKVAKKIIRGVGKVFKLGIDAARRAG